MALEANDLLGWWDLTWKGGSFEVSFRPLGLFFCAKHQAQAKWELEDGVVKIDWGKFGKYELVADPEQERALKGHQAPKNDANPNNWRTAEFKRPLSDEEMLLFGDGAGSEWDFQWSGGSFPVQFKADGYNHFVCDDFPAHAHWSLEGKRLRIFWDKYGTYDLDIDAENKTMAGGSVDGDWTKDTEWRKGQWTRKLLSNKVLDAGLYKH